MTKLKMLKAAGELVISIGVGDIVTCAIKKIAPLGMGKVRKACFAVGALILTSMATDKATEYVEIKANEMVIEFNKLRDKKEETVKE